MTDAQEEFCRRYLAAAAQMERGDVTNARREFELLTLEVPRFAPAWDGLGRCLDAEGDLLRSAECFRRAIRLDRGNWRSRYHWGRSLHHAGDLKAACRLLNEAVRIAPGERLAHRALGLCHFDRAEYDQALRCFRKALEQPEREVTDGQLYLDIGRAETERGELEAAEEAYERACLLSPDNSAVFYHWAIVSRRRGDHEGANALAGRAANLASQSPQYALLRVTLAMDAGRWEAAEQRIEALKDLPETGRLRHALRAELALRTGRREQARECALQALAADGPLSDQAVDRALATLRELRGLETWCRGFRLLLEVLDGDQSYFRPYVVMAADEEQAVGFAAELQEHLDAHPWRVVETERFVEEELALAGVYQVLLTRVLFPRETSLR